MPYSMQNAETKIKKLSSIEHHKKINRMDRIVRIYRIKLFL